MQIMHLSRLSPLICRNAAGFCKNRRPFGSNIDIKEGSIEVRNGSQGAKVQDSVLGDVVGPPSAGDSDYVFSFDPTLKCKVIQISGDCQGSDFSRKMQAARNFIKSGHRVEVVIYTKQSKTQTDEAVEAIHSALPRQIDIVHSHLSDIAKPFTIKSKSRGHSRQFIIKFWPT